MPVYDFACPKEDGGFKRDVYLHTREGQVPACPKCEGEMERVYSLSAQHIAASSFPYTTTHITGQPIEIKSPEHLKEVCKEHNVVLRDDAAFVTKEYLGYDYRTKKQVYKEGSGVGLPGCWV